MNESEWPYVLVSFLLRPDRQTGRRRQQSVMQQSRGREKTGTTNEERKREREVAKGCAEEVADSERKISRRGS